MLSYNVASLLRAAPGTERRYPVDDVELDIADDLTLAQPINGEVRLQLTGRTVLARASLSTAIQGYCSRCLKPVVAPIDVEIEEVALPTIDIDTGLPVAVEEQPDALRLDDHHELDLAEPVREAISLAEPITLLCREECRGLCPTCGIDLNTATDHSHTQDAIDPRLASLASWTDKGRVELDQGEATAMGVPKRRVSHARQGERRAHHALSTPQLEECPHCHQQKRAHHACANCGWYNGREAVHIKTKTKPESAA